MTENISEQIHKNGNPEEIANKRKMFEIIALTGGNNIDFKVAWNKKGEGSCWIPGEKTYRLDEGILEDSLEEGLGVTQHEANHEIVSDLGSVQDVWGQLGFSFGFNAAEDPRANQGGMKILPGTKPWIKAYIEKDLGPNGQLNYQDMEEEARKESGYVPKFMKGGAELIRYWHEKEFANSLNDKSDTDRFLNGIPDKEVRTFIDSVKEDFEKYYQTVPGSRDQKERKQRAKESSDIFKKNIWPKYQKLIDQSMKDQSMVDMVKDMLKGQPQPGQGGGQGQGVSIPFETLPKDVQDEIKQKMKEEAQKQKDKQQQSQKGQQAGQQSGQQPGQEKQGESQSGGQEGQGEDKSSGQSKAGKPGESKNAKESPGEKQSGEGEGKDGEQGNIPWDELSDKTKKEIEKTFDKLPDQEKKKHQEQAKKDLEEAEDKANEKLNGEIKGTNHGQSHKEIREQTEKDEKDKRENQKEQEQKEKERQAEKTVKDMGDRQESQTANLTENAYQEIINQPEVAVALVKLDREYKRIFQPDEAPSVRYSYTGFRPSMPRAMQREADPRKGNVFEVRGRPTEKNYRFLWLIDQSGSMRGSKIRETMEAVVINAQLADRHNLETAIYGFTDYPDHIREYKGFDVKRMRNEDRAKIARLQGEGGGSTPTLEATRKSYKILKNRVSQHPMQNNYFITLTDGSPDGGSEDVTREIAKIRKDPTIITCGFGIGPATDFVNESYPQMPDIVKRKIAIALGKAPDEISNSFENAIDFVKASVIIMPYWVEHPEMFH